MPFPYFGGKYRLARHYPPPVHDTIIEPFAGSAAYALFHHFGHRVILVEKDPQIVALWKWLITEATPQTILELPDIERGTPLDVFGPMGTPARTLINLVAQSAATDRHLATEWMAARWNPRRRRVADRVDRIRDWTIIAGDYTLAPNMEATWFIDPPYQTAKDGYRSAPNTDIDYTALSAWCRSRKGQVIVCEHEGADWLPFRDLRGALTQSKAMRRELIWEGEDT